MQEVESSQGRELRTANSHRQSQSVNLLSSNMGAVSKADVKYCNFYHLKLFQGQPVSKKYINFHCFLEEEDTVK